MVKIRVTPMYTEYKLHRDEHVTDVLGHEAAGEVVEVAQPSRVKVGDRVAVMPQYPCGTCRYRLAGDYVYPLNNLDILKLTGNSAGTAPYAQYVLKQDWLLIPMITDRFPRHRVQGAWELQMAGNGGKILLYPWGEAG